MTKKDGSSAPEALTEQDLDGVDGGAVFTGHKVQVTPKTLEVETGKLLDSRGSLTQLNTNQSSRK